MIGGRFRATAGRILALLGGLLVAAAAAAHATTLEDVRATGQLRCGIVAEPEDWTKGDLHAGLAPFGVEFCKAVAIAVLGEKARVDVHPYKSGLEGQQGLRRGDVALVMGLTLNATSMWSAGIAFGPPVFFDGQSVLVRHDSPARAFGDLDGHRVCFIEGTENEEVIQARARRLGTRIVALPFQEEGEMVDGLSDRHCDAIGAYVSRLAQERSAYPTTLGRDRILDDWSTIEPVAPAYRQDDPQWAAIVAWTVSALLQAEQSGIGRATVQAAARNPDDPAVKRLLGLDWAAARALGLTDHDWAAKVIEVVGNYAEIYDRTIGRTLHLPRGRNALWTAGGLLYPLPVQ